jgi:hypothetical protein
MAHHIYNSLEQLRASFRINLVASNFFAFAKAA